MREKREKKKAIEGILFFIIIACIILFVWNFISHEFQYERFNTESILYERAIVTAVVKEELTLYESDDEHMIGYQLLRVKFLEGDEKGIEKEIENEVSITHNVILKKGDRLIVCADRPKETEPFYSVYNYDRSVGIWSLIVGFLFLVILVGKRQGVKSCLGLIFTMAMVICFLLPKVYKGESAVFVSILTIGVSSAVTCFCIGGLEKKTLYNMISATLGGMSSGVIYFLISQILKVGGNSMDAAESLALIAQSTGMRLNGVLFAGIMVAALGAVMDVAVSLSASLNEIKILNPSMNAKQLFQSGMNIGKDMIGTMTNTLILAFAGGSLSTLIIFISYGVQYNQLLSSNFLAVEMMQGIAGSGAVILTVPITAAVCALGYGKRKR